MGDSKASVTRYLNDSLATVAGKTVVEVVRAVRQVQPVSAASGQAVRIGRLAATTVPPRARVHVGDVYYGLSPLNLELQAGVHVIRFSLDGFKSVSEKVSVRSGETTELEVTLER
jgi:hypothetical protein